MEDNHAWVKPVVQLCLLCRWCVLNEYIQDTIGINIKADCDPRNIPGSWNAGELKLTKQVVVSASLILVLSPSYTWINTPGWLS